MMSLFCNERECNMLRNDIQGLILSASDADETIRQEAMSELKSLNPPDAKEVLDLALNDPRPEVRTVATDIIVEKVIEEVSVESNDQSYEQSIKQDDLEVKKQEIIDDRKSLQNKLWIFFAVFGISSLIFSILILIFMYLM